jgi:N-formylglutamate amidohydrolase
MNSKKADFKKLLPLLVRFSSSGVSINLSKRFILFDLLKGLNEHLEEKPFLNLVSFIRYENIYERFVYGKIKTVYDKLKRNPFKKYFISKHIHSRILSDLNEVMKINDKIDVIIFSTGIIIYDNYQENNFNVLLLTLHGGEDMPDKISKKVVSDHIPRKREEDIHSDKLYRKIVLKQGGVWIDNKISRFFCDLNRDENSCIHQNNSDMINYLWSEELSSKDEDFIYNFYENFYALLEQIFNFYKFNIVFDGHTMRNAADRPNISFGTHYIPKFYLPVVSGIKKKMHSMGYSDIGINKPYEGGFILNWISQKYPSTFIFSMEINKKLYLYSDRIRPKPNNIEKLSDDLIKIFDIQEEEGYRLDSK